MAAHILPVKVGSILRCRREQSLAVDRSVASLPDYNLTHQHSFPLQFPHLQQISHNFSPPDIALLPKSLPAPIHRILLLPPRFRNNLKLKGVLLCSGPLRQTLRLERTRILPKVSMSVLSVRTRLAGTQRYGLVGRVGPYSISDA